MFTLRVYATLTAGNAPVNADVYATRNAVVCRELRQLGLSCIARPPGHGHFRLLTASAQLQHKPELVTPVVTLVYVNIGIPPS